MGVEDVLRFSRKRTTTSGLKPPPPQPTFAVIVQFRFGERERAPLCVGVYLTRERADGCWFLGHNLRNNFGFVAVAVARGGREGSTQRCNTPLLLKAAPALILRAITVGMCNADKAAKLVSPVIGRRKLPASPQQPPIQHDLSRKAVGFK